MQLNSGQRKVHPVVDTAGAEAQVHLQLRGEFKASLEHETLLGYFQICYCCFEICSNNAAPVGLKICHIAQVFNNNPLASTLSAGIRGTFHSVRLSIY